MTKAFVFALLIAGCTGSGSGELKRVADNGGGFVACDQTVPWCGYDGTLDGARIELTSNTASASASGTLTPAALDELEALVADIPASTPADHLTCADSATLTVEIVFAGTGARTFRYDCEAGALADVDHFVADVTTALIDCQSNARVTVTACN